MIGAVVASSPSARYARMPTTVLAARHMRRATSLIQPQREGRPSADDEAAPGPHRLSSGSGGATPAVPLASPSAPPAPSSSEPAAAARHLGTGLAAVAVSQQAGQPAEEVLLFFGIIDFLQVGAGPQLLSCVLLLSCVHVCAILLSRALLTLGTASLMTPTSSTTCSHYKTGHCLQEYNMRKKLEHSIKAVVQDGKAISGAPPLPCMHGPLGACAHEAGCCRHPLGCQPVQTPLPACLRRSPRAPLRL